MNSPRHLLLNCVILLFSALFALGLIEAVVRIFFAPNLYVSEYGERADFVVAPYVMFAEPSVEKGGGLNQQGFQGRLLTTTRIPGEIRVALLGGSAAWAGGDKESIAAYMEIELRQAMPGRDIRVVNFGRQSYVSTQESILLQRNVLPLEFDLIVVYDGFNDVVVPLYAEPHGVGYPFLFSNLEDRVMGAGVVRWGTLLRHLARYSATFGVVLNRALEAKRNTRNSNFSLPMCLEEYSRNLRQMIMLSRSYHSKILIASQPFIGDKKPLSGREVALLDPERTALLQEYLASLRSAAKQIAEDEGASFVPAYLTFDGETEEIFSDWVHVTPSLGNPKLAKRIADTILQGALFR